MTALEIFSPAPESTWRPAARALLSRATLSPPSAPSSALPAAPHLLVSPPAAPGPAWATLLQEGSRPLGPTMVVRTVVHPRLFPRCQGKLPGGQDKVYSSLTRAGAQQKSRLTIKPGPTINLSLPFSVTPPGRLSLYPKSEPLVPASLIL